MLKMETPEGIKAFRIAMADCATKFFETTEHKLSPEDTTLAIFQLAASMAFARGGDQLENMEWAVRNFVENLSILHDVKLNFSCSREVVDQKPKGMLQ